jgi:transcriptional regulator with XRE-family HTH domain
MNAMKTTDRPVAQRVCFDCGKTMIGRRENYNYSECGLRSVVLLNILVFHCSCGTIVPEIPAPSVLHVSIAMCVLAKRTLLSGEEIRFVRKVAGYSATEFARVLGVANTSLSHWETGSKDIGKDSDRLVRLVCFTRVIENIAGADCALPENIGRLAKVTTGLNLTAVLEQIEDRSEGSQSVKINPDGLTSLGPVTDLEPYSLVVQ